MNCASGTNPFNKTWIAGDSEEIVIRYLDSESTPIPIQSAKIHLRKKKTSVTEDLEIIGQWNSLTGEIVFSITPAETRSLATSPKVVYVYDIELTMSATEIKTVGEGNITIFLDITR